MKYRTAIDHIPNLLSPTANHVVIIENGGLGKMWRLGKEQLRPSNRVDQSINSVISVLVLFKKLIAVAEELFESALDPLFGSCAVFEGFLTG